MSIKCMTRVTQESDASGDTPTIIVERKQTDHQHAMKLRTNNEIEQYDVGRIIHHVKTSPDPHYDMR